MYKKGGEVLVGTVVEHIPSSSRNETASLGEKRPAENPSNVIRLRVKKWCYTSGLCVTPDGNQQYATARKMPGLSLPANSEDECDTVDADTVVDYAIVLHYKIFEDEYSFLYGMDNIYVTDDEKYTRPVGFNSNMVLLVTAMTAALTSRMMSSIGQLQKDRKYLSIPGFNDACWKYMHRKYWNVTSVGLFDEDAEADKRKRKKESVVRRNVTMVQNTADLSRVKTIERNKVLEQIICHDAKQVKAVTKLFGSTFGIGPRIRPNKVCRRTGIASPRSGLAPATVINYIGALTNIVGGWISGANPTAPPLQLIKEPHRLLVIVNHKTMTVPNRHRLASIADTTMLPEGVVRLLQDAIVHPMNEIIEGVTSWLRDGRVWFAHQSSDGTGRMVVRNDDGEEREVPAGGEA